MYDIHYFCTNTLTMFRLITFYNPQVAITASLDFIDTFIREQVPI